MRLKPGWEIRIVRGHVLHARAPCNARSRHRSFDGHVRIRPSLRHQVGKKALQQSQQATNAAQAALAQAQGNAPMAVQSQLNMAQDALNMAGNQLGMGQPAQAGMTQAEAANALQQALDAGHAAEAPKRRNSLYFLEQSMHAIGPEKEIGPASCPQGFKWR